MTRRRINPDRVLSTTEMVRRLRAKRKGQGLCIYCGQPAKPHRSCGECRKEHRARSKKTYDARKAAGVCARCGGEKEAKRKLCASCVTGQSIILDRQTM